MKLIILSVMVGLAVCGSSDRSAHTNRTHPRNHAHGEEHEHEQFRMAVPVSAVYGKAKKLHPSPSSFGDGDNCALQCVSQSHVDIADDPELLAFSKKFSKPYRFADQHNVQILTKYCKVMNKTADCVRQCSDGPAKTIASKALTIPKYLCIETKYMEYAPCYDKVAKVNDQICNGANKCGSLKDSVESIHRSGSRTMADVDSLLSNTCGYFKCYIDCDQTKLVAECGAESATVLAGFYHRAVSTMFDLLTQLGITVSRPETCTRFLASGHS